MSRTRDTSNGPRRQYRLLAPILALFALLSIVGINWGLPTARNDKYLFSGEPPWPGEKIYRLASAAEKLGDARRGADVDVDPLDKSAGEPILLNGTDEQIAAIYLRYRLYTHQPDEMIAMMALAGMRPSRLELDPKLYQYGGLFIYPVGALLKLCGVVGLIDVRSDVVWYLDHPDEFGKFYIVSRAYSAAWGMAGVVIVFAIARRLGGSRAGVLAALLFTIMPVVICMAHEGKPHLPGAVLMLMAVWFAMRHEENGEWRIANSEMKAVPGAALRFRYSLFAIRHSDFWLMCLCCGAALGMVLSSLPIFVLIPLVAHLEKRGNAETRKHGNKSATSSPPFPRFHVSAFPRLAAGAALALGVYVLTNPYVVINALVPSRRGILASNFGNSLAMYEVSRVVEGFVRVVELTIEGAGLPIAVFGALAILILTARRFRGWSDPIGAIADCGLRIADSAREGEAPAEPAGARIPSRTPSAGIPSGVSQPPGEKNITRARRDESTREERIDSGAASPPTGPRVHGPVPPGKDAHLKSQISDRNSAIPLVVAAAVFLLQFVLIGAGKPAEYGRFGIFTNTTLAIATACLFTRRWTRLGEIVNWIPASMVVCWGGVMGWLYLANFVDDATEQSTRSMCAANLAEKGRQWDVAVLAEPAPYSCPPLDFRRKNVRLYPNRANATSDAIRRESWTLLLFTIDASEMLFPPVTQLAPAEWFPSSLVARTSERDWARIFTPAVFRPFRDETSISWAGKPAAIVYVNIGLRDAPLPAVPES